MTLGTIHLLDETKLYAVPPPLDTLTPNGFVDFMFSRKVFRRPRCRGTPDDAAALRGCRTSACWQNYRLAGADERSAEALRQGRHHRACSACAQWHMHCTCAAHLPCEPRRQHSTRYNIGPAHAQLRTVPPCSSVLLLAASLHCCSCSLHAPSTSVTCTACPGRVHQASRPAARHRRAQRRDGARRQGCAAHEGVR